MKSRANIRGHPLHAMLVGIPLAMFPVIALFDVLWFTTDDPGYWSVGWWLALVGLVVALVAAVPGLADLLKIPRGSRARRTGYWHMAVGLSLVALFALALYARLPVGSGYQDRAWALAVDGAGLVVTGVQGFLGGRLVYHHHAGVPEAEEGAEPVEGTPT